MKKSLRCRRPSQLNRVETLDGNDQDNPATCWAPQVHVSFSTVAIFMNGNDRHLRQRLPRVTQRIASRRWVTYFSSTLFDTHSRFMATCNIAETDKRLTCSRRYIKLSWSFRISTRKTLGAFMLTACRERAAPSESSKVQPRPHKTLTTGRLLKV